MHTLTVNIVQSELHWHNPDANRDHFESIISSLDRPGDLIVLPEMFTTGFTMDAASQAEQMDGASVSWIKRMAAQTGSSVCGSVIIEDAGAFYNRFVCSAPGGALATYDKRHLFRLADEQHHYTAGSERMTFDINGFRICPMVCYDLRFPVWSRSRGDFDLILYVANWPSRRQFAWDTLLRARAIENLSYAVGVNRVGTDGNDLPYTGGSSIIDFLGADLANLGDQSGTASATLDMQALLDFRERFAFHKDADDFTLE